MTMVRPSAKQQKLEKKKSPPPRIDIFKGWCKGCGICVAFCPKKALALDETGAPYVKDPSLCGRCGLCELRCPDFAITIAEQRDDEAAGPPEGADGRAEDAGGGAPASAASGGNGQTSLPAPARRRRGGAP
jgi:2-oxoglutarate ferredoxin oxidoreductase subunit delta